MLASWRALAFLRPCIHNMPIKMMQDIYNLLLHHSNPQCNFKSPINVFLNIMLNLFNKSPKEKKLLKVSDAAMEINRRLSNIPPHDLRKKINIVAIDDREFPPENNLRNSGFLIQVLNDIKNISEIENFQIILCDLNDIGVNLSPDTQGAYVIEEIKSKYPDKIVIAYTAASLSSKIFQKARQHSDDYLKKDSSIEKWRDLLDEKIKILANPIEAWKAERIRLLNLGMELQELILIEQAFLSNTFKDKESLEKAIKAEVENSIHWKGEITRFLLSKSLDFAFSYITK